MSLENARNYNEQALAVMDLIFDDPRYCIENDTVRNALYSVWENMGRVKEEIIDEFDSSEALDEVLIKRGIDVMDVYKEVMQVTEAKRQSKKP